MTAPPPPRPAVRAVLPLVAALLACGPATLRAQVSRDSLASLARADARREVAGLPLAGRFLGSFAGGIALGFATPIALAFPESLAPAISIGGGLALVAEARGSHFDAVAVPDTVSSLLEAEPAAYRTAYRAEYRMQLARKRRYAVRAGGLLGVAAGAGWLWWGLAHMGDF